MFCILSRKINEIFLLHFSLISSFIEFLSLLFLFLPYSFLHFISLYYTFAEFLSLFFHLFSSFPLPFLHCSSRSSLIPYSNSFPPSYLLLRLCLSSLIRLYSFLLILSLPLSLYVGVGMCSFVRPYLWVK